ncbi:MAG TPA: AAA family ATPase, partial [Thermomicrobiales bacterium]|nr:AAA family ATPase [Thermomicrobiales bacterium]
MLLPVLDAIPNVIKHSIMPPSLPEISSATNLLPSELSELEALLKEKKQIILEGPPGSGKTFVADKLARFLTGNPLTGDHNDRIEIVQFHQSYGYEDFVQGIRPTTAEGGGLSYNVQPGIFLTLCQRAREHPDLPYVLIIDEINRGNISRIFGELLMLLEYRDKKIRLPYGACAGFEDGLLSIPDNLLIIGTMNSTDRSLAVIDYALRRRFYFYRLMPVVDGQAPTLRRWLEQQAFAPEEQGNIHQLFVAMNQALAKHGLPPDFQIGHSYFMRSDINTDVGRQRLWQWAIIPLIREYFHNAKDDKM